MTARTLIGDGLLVAGTLLIVSAAAGMVRLPDVFQRTNAVSKAATLGVSCVLAGVAVLIPSYLTITTVVLAIAAQLFTAPVSGYAVGRAAYRSGAPLHPSTHRDDLAAVTARRGDPAGGGEESRSGS